jgi:membrane protein YqaA with SNARE-associated domain
VPGPKVIPKAAEDPQDVTQSPIRAAGMRGGWVGGAGLRRWSGVSPWLELAIVVALVLGINLIPAFGPPTWAVLVYFRVTDRLPIAALVLCGAAAAALGRFLLALLFRHLGSRLPERRRQSLDALGVTISGSRGGLLASLVFFAVSPVPSNTLFEAVGLARARLGPVVAAFCAGRVVSYSLYLTAASTVERQVRDVLEEGVTSPQAIALGVAGLAGLAAVVLIDWVRVIDGARSRWARWKGRPTPPSVRGRLPANRHGWAGDEAHHTP